MDQACDRDGPGGIAGIPGGAGSQEGTFLKQAVPSCFSTTEPIE